MGKADMTRDYYGDLEVQPSADAAEIKKQFKKLGKIPLLNILVLLLIHYLIFGPSLLGEIPSQTI